MVKPPASGTRLSQPEVWLEEHGDALYRYAYFRINDAALAEDLVQETLLAALQARDSFAGRSAERTWLTGILKNKLVDHLRKTAREQSVDTTPGSDEDLDALFDNDTWSHWKKPPSAWENPSAALEQQQFWAVFSDCLGGLPARQAEAFTLCELEGLDGGEVCKVLGIATSNVWVLLHRARLHLRQCLEDNWFGRLTGA
jgi:RNA polymerase sigma-70 factor (ECF subfamily)